MTAVWSGQKAQNKGMAARSDDESEVVEGERECVCA